MSDQVQIKLATIEDVPLILNLIRELAGYEQLAHEFIATEEQLRQTLFGDRKYAEVVIAYLYDKPVGFALFFYNYSTFLARPGIYLEDLYVREEARGKGVGQQFLTYLAKLAKTRECGRLESWVLDWSEPAIAFYQRLGAITMDELTVCRLAGDALNKLAI